jgi:hypothetical protein
MPDQKAKVILEISRKVQCLTKKVGFVINLPGELKTPLTTGERIWA